MFTPSFSRAAPFGTRVQSLWPLLLAAALLWLIARNLREISPAVVLGALGALGPGQWVGALLATAASFAALGRYEMVLHAALGTGQPTRLARHAGLRAIALSQLLGSGALTGALLRWRLLPGLSVPDALRLSALMSVTFLGALCGLASLALWTFGGASLPGMTLLQPLALLGLLLPLGLPLLRRASPHLSQLLGRMTSPQLLQLLALAALDCAFAALALHAVLPAGGPGFGTLLCAYLLALAAGLLSLAPGGLGAFDLALLALLPTIPEADLIAGLIAFRMVYFLVPGLLALPGLLRPRGAPSPALRPVEGAAQDAALASAPCPEWGLARQGGRLAGCGSAAWLLRDAPGVLAALGAPAGRADLPGLARAAREDDRRIALYKAPARLAVAARRAGWRVLRIGAVAEVDPLDWSPEGPGLRQLRRKLRRAEAAGLRVEEAARLPIAEMAALSDRWARAHGGERGFSMGVFDPEYLAAQRVLLAYSGSRLVAFASFHAGRESWALDLMRHEADAPSGTMQALVASGITAAGAAGIRKLSLAASPALPAWPRVDRRLPRGLAQFKSAFGPRWRPIYLCTPKLSQLPLSLAAIAFEIRWGHRLRQPVRAARL